MSATEKTLKISFPSIEFEHQALVITAPNDYKGILSLRTSFSDLSQNSTPFSEIKNSLQVLNVSLNEDKKNQQASCSDPSTVSITSKTPQKQKKMLNMIF